MKAKVTEKTVEKRVERSLCLVVLGWVQEEGSSIAEDAVVDIRIFNERVGIMPLAINDEAHPEKGGDEEDVGKSKERVMIEGRESHHSCCAAVWVFAQTSILPMTQFYVLWTSLAIEKLVGQDAEVPDIIRK